jgi:hypothetical protein
MVPKTLKECALQVVWECVLKFEPASGMVVVLWEGGAEYIKAEGGKMLE